MGPTKLLFILAFHYGAGDSSGIDRNGQQPQQFFDRFLQAIVTQYELDPLEREFSYTVEAALGTTEVNLYKATLHGLGTAHRMRENYIGANNSGTCLKIDMAVQNVTITILANVTVDALFFLKGTATIKLEANASFIEAQADIKENNVQLEVGSLHIKGVEAVDVKASFIGGTRLVFATAQGTLKSYVENFFKNDLESKLRAALEAKLKELNQYLLVD
uniref:Putative secreted protein n=1 Tax=Ixodes ricinus TaxID=34613 RepID=A0A090XD23_IXORI